MGNMYFDGNYVKADPVRGLVMMSEAKKLAAPVDYEWISQLQEEAFALATAEQRQKVIAQLATK